MWSYLRLLLVFLFPLAVLHAQEETPSASPEASPEASPAASPKASPESPPEATPSPTAEATPQSDASLLAEPTPTPEEPEEDVIPMGLNPNAPTIGAPLETTDLAPPDQAMPDEAFTLPNAIVPDALPPAPPKPAESQAEKARQLSILYHEVRIKVDKDPEVKSLRDQADTARTPEDRRAAFREYYRLLFEKMVALDERLKVRCQVMEEAYLRRLAQERLEPTIPLNPPPTPEPLP